MQRVEPKPVLNALTLWLTAPRASVYLVHSRLKGLFWLALGEYLMRRRRLVVLEFIRVRRSRVGHLVDFCTVFFLTRCSRRIHVLTEAEVGEYSKRYRVPESRFVSVLWPLHDDRRDVEPFEPSKTLRVMSSGRAACDWRTLLEAERMSLMDWNLLVVCGKDDEGQVKALAGPSVEVMVDIPANEHDALLRRSAIYVLCLSEENRSSGHIRLMNAFDYGVPVVATLVRGLIGYVDNGNSTVGVAPGDASGLVAAVDDLLNSKAKRSLLANGAASVAADRTFTKYLATIADLAHSDL